MNNKKILVTGAAGFIGYHLSKSLLDDGYTVMGVDNINAYYDTKLKKNRILNLNNYKKFSFSKIDISNKFKLKEVFNSFRPYKVINLAAQAGVRYSIENPYAYMKSNMIGFLNIIELCKIYNINGFVYASSSSVYGKNKKIPFSIDDNVDSPISLYAATKKSNELIANVYSELFNLHTTGLRFFTAYGPWGRPDMAIFIFVNNILKNKPIQIFNHGKMKRDFTYIDDIVNGIRLAMDKNYKCKIFNLGNNKSEDLMKVVKLIEENLNCKAKIEFQPMQMGDVKESFANIDKSIEMLNYKPSVNIEEGIKKFIDWYKSYHNLNDL